MAIKSYALPPMNTEPTDAEINEGIAKFCGYSLLVFGSVKLWQHQNSGEIIDELSYTTSFDALREAMGKMTEEQRECLIGQMLHDGWSSYDDAEWLLFYCPVRTLAEAVYQVVKGENK